MIRLGITGGIGSGKSYVARLLEAEFGVPVYNCDGAAKRIMTTDAEVRSAIVGLVGPDAYQPDGSLCREAVARYLFASAHHAQCLNAIVHPSVRADAEAWFERLAQDACPPPVAALESAILIEAGFRSLTDKLLVVEAPTEVRIQRVCRRDGLTPAQVRARIAAQLDDESRRRQADYVVMNDGRDLHSQLTALMRALH